MNPKYKIQLYRVNVTGSEFEYIDEITTYQNLSFSRVSNDIGGARFTMNLYDEKLLPESFQRYRTIVVITRNGVPVWVGFLYKRSINVAPDNNEVTLECLSYFALLKKRHVLTYTSYDDESGNIAWDLINITQNQINGELMIRRGTVRTTGAKKRNYPEYTVIHQALSNLSTVNGSVDFDFVPRFDADNRLDQVTFDLWQTRGTLRENFSLSFKDNVIQMFATDFVAMANVVYTLGQGTGEAVQVGFDENTSSQTAYKRLETVETFQNVLIQETLDDKAQRLLEQQTAQKYDMAFKLDASRRPFYGDFDLEDIIRYDFTSSDSLFLKGYGSGTARVKKIDVVVSGTGAEFLYPHIDFIN